MTTDTILIPTTDINRRDSHQTALSPERTSRPATCAGRFLDRLQTALLENERCQSEQSKAAIRAEMDLTCDALLDADILAMDVDMFAVPGLGQKRFINFPDNSTISSLIWWGEDHIDLIEGHHPRHDWMSQPDGKVMIFAHDAPTDLAFDRLISVERYSTEQVFMTSRHCAT